MVIEQLRLLVYFSFISSFEVKIEDDQFDPYTGRPTFISGPALMFDLTLITDEAKNNISPPPNSFL